MKLQIRNSNIEIRNNIELPNGKTKMGKTYDLEDRTEAFAKAMVALCGRLPRNIVNLELISQAVRSAGSVGANYIEANEALSKKDFVNRVKISRKEAKECRYWLRLILSSNANFEKEISALIQESTELMNIFGAILRKSTEPAL
jgi:four helix bundle protein